jgi:hypothetical protein
MAAIQVMRQRAQAAGSLNTTPQQVVTAQGPDISIEPANPEVVYVPAYDPWVVYGAPVFPWPDWYPYPGIWYAGPYLSFGIGFPIGFFAGFGWGWPHWGFDWHRRHVEFDRSPYFSHSTTFYNRGNFYGGARGGFGGGARPAQPGRLAGGGVRPAQPGRPEGGGVRAAQPGPSAGGGMRPAQPGRPAGGGVRPTQPGRPTGGGMRSAQPGPPAGGWGRAFTNPGVVARPFNGSVPAARGYAAPRGESGTRSSAFSGYNRGGDTRGFASRGSTSAGGGAPARGGGARPGGHR